MVEIMHAVCSNDTESNLLSKNLKMEILKTKKVKTMTSFKNMRVKSVTSL